MKKKAFPVRSVPEWREIIRRMRPIGGSLELAAAERVLQDLVGYRKNALHRNRDAVELANFILAIVGATYTKYVTKDIDYTPGLNDDQ